MKTIITFTTLVLLVAPAWAYHQDNDPDQKQSITNVHASHFPHVTLRGTGMPRKGVKAMHMVRSCSIFRRASGMFPMSPAITIQPKKGMGTARARH
ncbi:MAG: hypothetical protein ABT21_15105 [Thiobacillus sp. SCN 65-179]|nr:MAG: hypothetical protein ABT21_15105 [Thiobacillus sp. SCN 65-179]